MLRERLYMVRCMSRTAHPKFGGYRESSPLWKPTKANLRENDRDMWGNKVAKSRTGYSHEFVGSAREQVCPAPRLELRCDPLQSQLTT
eukprot:1305629-Prymnesium_polylepis.2